MTHFCSILHKVFGISCYLSNYKHYVYQTEFFNDSNVLNQRLAVLFSDCIADYFLVSATTGFISFSVKPSSFIKLFGIYRKYASLATKDNVVIDCIGVNFCKHIHFGHLRSSVTGVILKRCFEILGSKCVIDTHFGDYGSTIASVLNALLSKGDVMLNQLESLTIDDLHSLYITGGNNDTSILIELENLLSTGKLETSTVGLLYKAIRKVSMDHISEVFKLLNLEPDLLLGESRYLSLCRYLINVYMENNVFYYNDSRLMCRVGNSEVTLARSDNTLLYLFTDIACLIERGKLMCGVKRVIYVVDVRQKEHFSYLFGFYNQYVGGNLDLDYIPTGMVKMSGGMTLKSRAGKQYNLIEFIEVVQSRFYKTPIHDIVNALVLYDIRHCTTSNYTIDETSFYKEVIDIIDFRDNIKFIINSSLPYCEGDNCSESELALYGKFLSLYENVFNATVNYRMNSIFNTIKSIMLLVKKISNSLRRGLPINESTVLSFKGDPVNLLNALIPMLVC